MEEDDEDVGPGLAALAGARETLAQGARSMLTDEASAEEQCRKSLASFASAMNWLEDTEHFETAHRALDEAGAFVRRAFGCTLHQEGRKYEQQCPVAIAHKRLGLSVEAIIATSECTICGQDEDDCPHILGRVYDGERCHRVVTDAEFVGVAFVSRPEQPDARLMSLPIDIAGLRRRFGSAWRPGMPVNCDRCLYPCGGVEEFDFAGLNAERAAVARG